MSQISAAADKKLNAANERLIKDIRAGNDKESAVSGLEGRRTTYVGSAPFRIESVVARDGQVVYQIQIFYTPACAADAQRILKSIKIAHAQ